MGAPSGNLTFFSGVRTIEARSRIKSRMTAAPSERQPAVALGEAHVAGVDAQPEADAEPDRDQHHVAAPQILGGEAADEIGVALGAGEALEQLLAVVEVVDQHEHLVGVAAEVEADRRAGPVDLAVALDLVVHRPRAVANAEDERAAGFLAGDVGGRLALVA